VSTPLFVPPPAFAPTSIHNSNNNSSSFYSRVRSRSRRALSFRKSTTTALKSTMSDGTILESPSAERNKDPILSVLQSDVFPHLKSAPTPAPVKVKVLEVAAGCGVHTIHLARGVLASCCCCDDKDGGPAGVEWYPTDPSPASRESIDARVAALGGSDPVAAVKDGGVDAVLKGSVMPARSLTLDADGVMEGRLSEGGTMMMSDLPDPIADLPDATFDLVVNINMIHISPWEATIGLMKTSASLLRRGGMLYCYGPYKVNGTAVRSNLNFDESLRSRDASWGLKHLEDVVAEAERCGLKLIKTVDMPANNLSVLYRKQ